jgi:hypothetical protein
VLRLGHNVEANFVALEQLDEPWRWKNVGNEELGEWLLDARGKLVNGQQIDSVILSGLETDTSKSWRNTQNSVLSWT